MSYIENRTISKSFDISRFFQNKTHQQRKWNKVTPLKNTYIKFAKPEVIPIIDRQEFPQMILKKIKMNFRITSRKESFNESSIQLKQTKKQNQLLFKKNPQKLFFQDQLQEQSVDDQIDPIRFNNSLSLDKNFIDLNIKTLTLNQQIQKNPVNLFRNQILKQKFNQKLRTQECPEVKQNDPIQDISLIYSTIIKKRHNQRKGQFTKSQLRKVLNSKQLKKKEKSLFKISTSKSKKQSKNKEPTKITIPKLA